MLVAWTSLFIATSCDTQNNKGYSVSSRDRINWQGLAAHDVERARQEFHVDGSGVKVCVISDSLKHLDEAKDIAPQDVAVLLDENGHRQDGRYLGDGEGTAMLEIVHSIAPGAELMFATKGNSAGTMAKNISALGNLRNKDRCHIIVDDAEFYFQSPFQDDVISKAVNEVAAKDILYITSAGNRGNTRAGTSAAWEGYFRAGRVLRDARGRPVRIMHVFADKQNGEYNDVLGECGKDGGEVHVELFWNDPILKEGDNQPADLSDYELWALNSNGVLKDKEENYIATARSHKTQSCQDDKNENNKNGRCVDDKHPCRHICFPAPNGTDSDRTSVVITKVAGKGDRFLHLDFHVKRSGDKNGCRLEHGTRGVISGHHGAESAFSVASKSRHKSALDPDGVFLGGPAEHVDRSSAEGPRRMFFTPNGRPYDCPRDLQKPDVTAADGVTTDVPEKDFQPFYGTSAAAPQVAGIAALLKSKDPSLTAEEIKSALRRSAIQIEGPAEWNPLSGYGIVNAMRALRAIETVKGHKASSRICANDDRRPRRIEQPLRSSMAMRRSSQAGAHESGARNVHGGCSRVERETRRHCAGDNEWMRIAKTNLR
jgi:Subtilase family